MLALPPVTLDVTLKVVLYFKETVSPLFKEINPVFKLTGILVWNTVFFDVPEA